MLYLSSDISCEIKETRQNAKERPCLSGTCMYHADKQTFPMLSTKDYALLKCTCSLLFIGHFLYRHGKNLLADSCMFRAVTQLFSMPSTKDCALLSPIKKTFPTIYIIEIANIK